MKLEDIRLNLYKRKYPFMKCLDIMEAVRKRKDVLLWRVEYKKWDERHFQEIQRIEKGEEPKMLIEYEPTPNNSAYIYYLDGQQTDLSEIAFELGIKPQSVINALCKNNNDILRKGLRIKRIKKDEQ